MLVLNTQQQCQLKRLGPRPPQSIGGLIFGRAGGALLILKCRVKRIKRLHGALHGWMTIRASRSPRVPPTP
jgi:hypothetical protein